MAIPIMAMQPSIITQMLGRIPPILAWGGYESVAAKAKATLRGRHFHWLPDRGWDPEEHFSSYAEV